MRIVYDDARIGLLTELVAIWARTRGEHAQITKYSYGMYRVEAHLVKQDLGNYLKNHGFEIGNMCYHAHGIGNNNRNPVYFHTETETQEVGYVNIIISPYGSGSVYVTDYNDKLLGVSHKLSSGRRE